MNLLNNLISDEIISALGWTIVHSLWQGALVAIMLASLLVIMKKTDSRIRSLVSIGALVIFVALTVRTFTDTYNKSIALKESNLVVVNTTPQVVKPAAPVAIENAATENPASIENYFNNAADFFIGYFKEHLPMIVLLWLLGVVVLTLRLIGGYAYTQRLKSHKVFPVTEKWKNSFNQLCKRINIKRPVELAESAIVKIPVTIGYFKPVILLPLGSLTGLPTEQVEAIIVHELAHIQRADFIINIIQSVVETIFFYHPAVWWMSSAIRKERENCCDDMAVETCGDSFTYAKALVNVRAFGSGETGLAMAVFKKNEKLFRRINRMILKQKNPGLSGKLAAASLLLVSLFAATLISCSSANNDEYFGSHKSLSRLEKLEDFSDYRHGDKHLSYYEDDVKWEVYLEDGEIVELYKDGDRIPDDEIDEYSPRIYSRLDQLSRDLANLKEELKDMDVDLANLDEELYNLKDELRSLSHKRHKWDSDREKADRKRYKRELSERERERVRSSIKFHIDDDFVEKMEKLGEELEDLKICFDDDNFHFSFNDDDFDFNFDFDHDFDIDFDNNFDHDINVDMDLDLDDLRINLDELHDELSDLDIHVTIPDIPPIPDLSDLKIDLSDLKVELKKLENYLDEVKSEMVDDGIIDDEDELMNMEYEHGRIYVNGDRLSDDLNEKYKDIYRKHFGHSMEEDTHIHFHD